MDTAIPRNPFWQGHVPPLPPILAAAQGHRPLLARTSLRRGCCRQCHPTSRGRGCSGSRGQLCRAGDPGAEPQLTPKGVAALCGEGRHGFQPRRVVISLKVSITSGLKKQKGFFFACLYFSPHQYWGQAGHFQTVPGAYSAIKDRNYIFITQDIAARLFMTCSISRIFILDREPDNFHPIYFS